MSKPKTKTKPKTNDTHPTSPRPILDPKLRKPRLVKTLNTDWIASVYPTGPAWTGD